MSESITSPANPRIKAIVRLRDRRRRDQTKSFIIEGYRELLRAVGAGMSLQTVYVCPELFVGSNEPALVERCRDAGAEVIEVADVPFRKVSYRDRPEGLLAVADQFDTDLGRIPLESNPLLLVAESIEKPGNLGTMMRTADAAGLTGIMVADPTTDPFNPNVVRASLGTLFSLPLAIGDTPKIMDHLNRAGITIVATTPDATVAHYDADLTGPIALIIGSEQYGLSAPWLEQADMKIHIPMPGPVDSLNTAMAAGVVIFEAVRQRT